VSDQRVNSVFFDHSGKMWLGTQDGFEKFDPTSATARAYYERDGLAGNAVSCILEDENGMARQRLVQTRITGQTLSVPQRLQGRSGLRRSTPIPA
jgi:ligand-binding sensor domain-containing protein